MSSIYRDATTSHKYENRDVGSGRLSPRSQIKSKKKKENICKYILMEFCGLAGWKNGNEVNCECDLVYRSLGNLPSA